MTTYTKFRDTCFQMGHPDRDKLMQLLHWYHRAQPRPGISCGQAKQGDIVLLLYRDLSKYNSRTAHASVCFLDKSDDSNLFVSCHQFHNPNSFAPLFGYNPVTVRKVDASLHPFLELLEVPLIPLGSPLDVPTHFL